MSYNTENLEFVEFSIDYFYSLHKKNVFYLFLKHFLPFNKPFHFIQDLTLEKLIKVGICYIQHLTQFQLLNRILQEINVTKILPEDKYINDLIIELQETLLDSSKESSIFNYQFNSYKFIENIESIKLGQALNTIIMKYSQNHKIVYQYYNSILATEAPPLQVIKEIQLNDENLLEYCKTL